MTATKYAPSHHMQPFRPGEHTLVDVCLNGAKQWSWDIADAPEAALIKAYEDLCVRARCGALVKGLWQVRVGELSEDLKVD